MLKESKTKSDEIKNEVTKMMTMDNTLTFETEMFEEVPRYTPLSRSDFNMNILDNWSEIRTRHQPKRRSFHISFIYNDYLFVIGGIDIITGKLSDMKRILFKSEYPAWEEITPLGVVLEPLAYHAGCLCEGFYYIIGGQNKIMNSINTIYIYDIENNKLDKIKPKEAELPFLENHTANLYNKSIIIFGGFSQGSHMSQVYLLDTETKKVKKVSTNSKEDTNAPLGRVNHASVIIQDNLYIFGGETKEGNYLNDMWCFDLFTNTWTGVTYSSNDIPFGRSGHSMVHYESCLFIFGGKAGNMNETNDLWKFNLTSKHFTILHDVLIEQFTEKELLEYQPKKEDDSNKGKSFKILTKRDIPALNPLSKTNKNSDKVIRKNEIGKSLIMHEFRQKCEKELCKSPLASKIKKSIIYNLETDMTEVLNRLNTLFQNKHHRSQVEDLILCGNPPLPRDGQSAVLHEDKLIIFGGDRNKFPFNDLFAFSLK